MNKKDQEKENKLHAALDEHEATKEAVFEALDCAHTTKKGAYTSDTLFKSFLEKLDHKQPEEIMGEFAKFVDTPGNYVAEQEEADHNIIFYFKQHFQEDNVLMIYAWYCKNWRLVWDWIHTRPKRAIVDNKNTTQGDTK